MKITTSKKEIKDLIKAWVAISIAFGIVLYYREGYLAFLIAAIAVGFGFLFHELGHKIVAQHYNLYAEFRSFDQMLILAILMAYFLKIVFAAPGAVMIKGTHYLDSKKNGKISLSGPLVNIILAFIFLILVSFKIFPTISGWGLFINALIALFNMIPFGNFDGAKILRWNKPIYFIVVFVAFVLMTL